MRILVIGSGGREHAMAWKLSQNPRVERLFIAPGNGGTAEAGENVDIKDDDIRGLVAFARKNSVDLVVPGPELPLVLGVTDAMTEAGIPCFGPDAYAAKLEGSKLFAKTVMREAGVPTAGFAMFQDVKAAREFVRDRGGPVVVKADGLAAGKGVAVCHTVECAEQALEEMLVANRFGGAGSKVLVEDLLEGEEASFLAFCDGERVALMPSSQDHKAIGDGDTGPNTGGMGAYSPAPVLPRSRWEETAELVILPIIRHMKAAGHPFRGVLYAGIMMTEAGPMVLEYNVRFGDPECQPLLMRLDCDLTEVMLACAQGRLDPAMVRWKDDTALCVVMAAQGYPEKYEKGMRIEGIRNSEELPGVKVFQAGTRREDGLVISSGGRVLGVTALAPNLAAAQKLAYQAIERIQFPKSYFRRDIGAKGLGRGV
ncbi:phosphoribosylamine--glycine ligase [Desulfocurvibacter africanus]|uniref:Phosphoribosylamine--glycine ligase n=1 Tax=Desulfocurvibacter africanus subsp. africanus str. Walvis Bay TaxID=690850 RepID=F3YU11_DESAF|nr:phosphoribosylamine--glycine ligase [Desulfocurvibacter africanus]EGJ48617.1 Phosphoribosylamine--glycine ligase [Desulfocurvibacter africanus subsp. africanus str. Walvis Bay]